MMIEAIMMVLKEVLTVVNLSVVMVMVAMVMVVVVVHLLHG